jgi:hypothetical protein
MINAYMWKEVKYVWVHLKDFLSSTSGKCPVFPLRSIVYRYYHQRAIEVEGQHMEAHPHASNNIRFDYVGISFKSTGDIRYRYRLVGLDSNWNETRETFLSYPTLPSGVYELQLQAINKFDVHSEVINRYIHH